MKEFYFLVVVLALTSCTTNVDPNFFGYTEGTSHLTGFDPAGQAVLSIDRAVL